jgi:hypothetical protein
LRTEPNFRFGENEAFNARPGDEIHVTRDGRLFLSRPDGPTWFVRVNPPRVLSTLLNQPHEAVLLARDARVVEVSRPSTVCDQEGAAAIASRLHTPGMEIKEVEDSPELTRFKEVVAPLVEALADLPPEVGSKWLFRDHTGYRRVALIAYNQPKIGGHDGLAPEVSIHWNFDSGKAVLNSKEFYHTEMELPEAIEHALEEIQRVAREHNSSPTP